MERNRGVITNRAKEVIYEYGDELSRTHGVNIEIQFNGGNRKLLITNNGQTTEFALKNPKKPEGTGAVLKFANTELLLSEELAAELPFPVLSIEREKEVVEL